MLGKLIHKYEGTLERFSGDGIMVFFNDPLPCPDPSLRAVQMAIEMRDDVGELLVKWRKHGHELGFGVGIAHGYATLGRIGFEGRFRLWRRRHRGQSRGKAVLGRQGRANPDREQGAFGGGGVNKHEPAGELTLKGIHRPVRVFNVCAIPPSATSAPASATASS